MVPGDRIRFNLGRISRKGLTNPVQGHAYTATVFIVEDTRVRLMNIVADVPAHFNAAKAGRARWYPLNRLVNVEVLGHAELPPKSPDVLDIMDDLDD
jgi:hypothetical protein